jgi:hypothetical protein
MHLFTHSIAPLLAQLLAQFTAFLHAELVLSARFVHLVTTEVLRTQRTA